MRCWYCGKSEMALAPELGSQWVKCPICGATWTEVPKPPKPMAEETVMAGRVEMGKHIKAR
ncbi:unnamed protein product, partial [marine sediment metagenome]